MERDKLLRLIEDLGTQVLQEPCDEFLQLCKNYLRQYHQLHDWEVEFRVGELPPEKRYLNVFMCTRRPPC